jgi:hypothetical protein
MVYVINEKSSKDELAQILKKAQSGKKGVNVRKYAGKVKVKGNPVQIIRQMRDEEWS